MVNYIATYSTAESPLLVFCPVTYQHASQVDVVLARLNLRPYCWDVCPAFGFAKALEGRLLAVRKPFVSRLRQVLLVGLHCMHDALLVLVGPLRRRGAHRSQRVVSQLQALAHILVGVAGLGRGLRDGRGALLSPERSC